jgi:predicted ATP-binding protein involved in virulence
MKIKQLQLKNFRGFEDLTIDFPEGESGLAVLVGGNGSGKTSLLEGIIDFLDNFCLDITRPARGKEILLSEQAPVIRGDDVKYGCKDAEISISFEYLGEKLGIYWKIFAEDGRMRFRSGAASDLEEKTIEKIRQKLLSTMWISAPLIAYYPAERLVIKQELKAINLEDFRPWNIYTDSLNKTVDFKGFFDWFRSLEDYENKQIRYLQDAKYRSRELEMVRGSIINFLEGFSNFRIKRKPPEEFVVEKNGQSISLSKLSPGERTILAMVGDIAKRASMVSNDLSSVRGVVLIDEIEQHLHPAWQRSIIPNLRRTFPNIQFILTTHSPQVISTLQKENVFILQDFKLVQYTPHTFGRDSNTILWDIFGVEKRPAESKKEFEKLYRLMDTPEKNNETADMLHEMEAKYGNYDEEIMRARGHFQFLNEG